MQRHAEKLQRAKEEAALKAMKRLVPNLSPAVWVLALEECSWDVERATVMLNTFQASRGEELVEIEKAFLVCSQDSCLFTSWCSSSACLALSVGTAENIRARGRPGT